MKVAASPRIYMGRCPKVVFKSLVTRHSLKLDATDQQLLDAGHAAAGLQSHALQGLRRVVTSELADE